MKQFHRFALGYLLILVALLVAPGNAGAQTAQTAIRLMVDLLGAAFH
jgi:hypothetical protein